MDGPVINVIEFRFFMSGPEQRVAEKANEFLNMINQQRVVGQIRICGSNLGDHPDCYEYQIIARVAA